MFAAFQLDIAVPITILWWQPYFLSTQDLKGHLEMTATPGTAYIRFSRRYFRKNEAAYTAVPVVIYTS